MGRLRHSVGLYCPQWMVLYRVNKSIRLSNFHDPLKRLKLNTLASDSVIKKDNAMTIPLLICQVIYVTSLNKRSDLRNLVNH